MRASFLSDAKAKFLLERGSGGRSPWFGKEAGLRPRDALVASPGYVFVSADYSQVQFCAAWRTPVKGNALWDFVSWLLRTTVDLLHLTVVTVASYHCLLYTSPSPRD